MTFADALFSDRQRPKDIRVQLEARDMSTHGGRGMSVRVRVWEFVCACDHWYLHARCRFHPNFIVSAKKGESAVQVVEETEAKYVFADEAYDRRGFATITKVRQDMLRGKV